MVVRASTRVRALVGGLASPHLGPFRRMGHLRGAHSYAELQASLGLVPVDIPTPAAKDRQDLRQRAEGNGACQGQGVQLECSPGVGWGGGGVGGIEGPDQELSKNP